ncbi:Uma2 family endonuclease [Candidatus Poribacteria bacterium]|nr:Uma2 family endonuclease [Candidatus Poribacteria bacterium]MYG07880.1 Uma2 family endonuclease [Candidatus Poribacteria bacterium]MYK22306.1 Uma2 family endonuclease [Candidatus Poribacteria bacterium]
MKKRIGAAPTLVYPESDGEPMAESGRHVKTLLDMIDAIDLHFRDVPDVHVSGNMFLYYEEGNPRKVISPDVFMVRGVSKKDLRTYKTWEQQPYLDFVLELASPSTYMKDFNEKKAIYEQILRVQEYCIYDPYHEIDPSFVGFRLVEGVYEEIAFVEGRLPFETLGLELGERDGVLRLYDPGTETWVGPSREHVDEAKARASEAETYAREVENRASEAENRASEEARARREAEAELEKLRAALQRLQTTK